MSVYQYIGFYVFLVLGVLLLVPVIYPVGVGSSFNLVSGYFIFDSLSFYLVLLVVFLGVYTMFSVHLSLTISTKVFLFFSLLFTVLCFCSNHSILFWCFYELSMLPLLYLIFVDSPYSERFIAGWYFSVYLLVTSLPLILILLYFSFLNNSFYFSSWVNGSSVVYLYVVLAFIFFTKVPLCPFHTWLPIVHAEATSVVSIFLSGYIMKLGLLGVYRCCPFLFQGYFTCYLFLCCSFSIFFIITASNELDGKRWLAFLSLSHILVPFLSFFVCPYGTINLSFFYCLGHGLSAGLVFGFLWYFYDKTGTRNWLLLKSGISGISSMFIVIFGLLSLCSFPTTIQFFCEVFIVVSSSFSWVYLVFWCLYLFFGGLIPLVLCGHLLVRCDSCEYNSVLNYSYTFYFLYIILWCYLGIIFL
uniref:NADH-ubiquinone oxidoreductase chain 4 n=1 Tax=Cephalochlamys namaquensis TaxID=406060 RepID=A0A8F7CBW2_9CEST|nr:NADH dehydrogenase subunit 4 [Cephalochlamys namaquensis]